ncbi:hypothetical protein AX768_09070 [Burkholderia sp. PAMC 28687]|nr:hypothetical protein AX768_09070 [Burkholderia sp. PAMC 28687]
MELSRDARNCFIGMWNFCDDAGIHPASPKRLKAEVFPADDLTAADVRRLVDECINVGLVEEYTIGDESFWIVTGWHHQKIDKPTFQHPRPDGSVPDGAAKRRVTRINTQNSTTSRVGVGEDSSNGSRGLVEASPPESSRVESKGVDKDKTIVPVIATGKPARSASDDFTPKNEGDWQRYFREQHGVELDATSLHDRKKAWPLFAKWAKAGITTAQMDAAIAKAHDEATDTIAFLPAYADRVLASMSKPERLNPDQQRRAISDANAAAWLAGETTDPNVIDMEH